MLAYQSRVNTMANKGPLMDTRIHTQNSEDIALTSKMRREEQTEDVKNVQSEEAHDFIKARSDLKVFTGDVVQNGDFTLKAKEAARHFFMQLSTWAGSFDDGGTGFYSSMGINNVIDCLYVDGMSLRSYLKEQYYYKASGNPAEVKYKNFYVDLSNVGAEEASRSRQLRERGNQVRSSLKKRLDRDMTETTGMAYRKAYGCEPGSFKRIENAKNGLKEAGSMDTAEYREFDRCFEHYNTGLQKLGLKPGRDDINLPVAEELRKRCSEAL